MNTILLIIVAVLAAAIGAGVVFFVKKGNTKDDSSSVKEQTDFLKADFERQTEVLKTKYESLLQESKNKVSELDSQLSLALNGKFDDVTKEKLAEVDSLKQKIKKLEVEIDDLEDDLDDEKKKFSKKNTECSELQDAIIAAQRESKQLKADVDSLKNELDDKIQVLNLKEESLSFVQEVLSAKDASDDSTQQLYSQVSDVVDFIRVDLRDNVKEIYDTSQSFDDGAFGYGLYGWAARRKKSWVSGKTSIAFVGEFSAGKTSIVNRILSQDDPSVPLLPVSTKATTAIPTYISGAPGALYQFVTPDNSLKCISEDTFKKVNKEVLDQIHGVSSLIKYFVIGYKNPNLDNLSILDTPGFNSNDPEDADRTIEVINECDALFWVFDVNAGTVNRSSLNLIKENLTKPLYIVINKVDTKPESEVDKVEKLITSTLQSAEINFEKIIRFSSKATLSDIMDPISQINRDTNQDNYLAALKDVIAQWVKELNDDVLEQKRNSDSLSKKIDSICDKYNKANAALENDCEAAADIPQYKSGFLGIGEGYKMNSDQYNNMINILNRICTTRVNTCVDLFNEMMNVAMEYSSAYDSHLKAKANWQLLNESYEKLNRITKGLN
ncbi:MAG: dynamin family protein [Bacteroidaceae bacterium]|nr:dynamin family protein [Bacteroidaceae bacterium]